MSPRRLAGPCTCSPSCPERAGHRGRDAAHQVKLTSSTARGYDYDHEQLRAEWMPRVKAGLVDCRRGDKCRAKHLRITPDEPWDLGHPDAECPAPIAPEHRGCNRGAPRRGGG